jgi:hypothetical protein
VNSTLRGLDPDCAWTISHKVTRAPDTEVENRVGRGLIMSSSVSDAAQVNVISKSDAVAWRETVTIRLSDKVRALALGVLAFSWAVMSADKSPVAQINTAHHKWLLITGLLSVLSLLFDLLQSLFNYGQSVKLLKQMESDLKVTGQFDAGSFLYKIQTWMFYLKIAVCIASCLSLLFLVGLSFL